MVGVQAVQLATSHAPIRGAALRAGSAGVEARVEARAGSRTLSLRWRRVEARTSSRRREARGGAPDPPRRVGSTGTGNSGGTNLLDGACPTEGETKPCHVLIGKHANIVNCYDGVQDLQRPVDGLHQRDIHRASSTPRSARVRATSARVRRRSKQIDLIPPAAAEDVGAIEENVDAVDEGHGR